MADARALLAAERKARRISHPYLTYTKSGQLLCIACQLNIKSEALWEGHLRSANHKKNAKLAQDANSRSLKRKLDDVDADEENAFQVEVEGRKKPKSRAVSFAGETADVNGKVSHSVPEEVPLEENVSERAHSSALAEAPATEPEPEDKPILDTPLPPDSTPTVDEDEWAAFEREVAPLALTDYSAATISAAPMSAEQLERQKEEDRRKQQEDNIEAEKEEEEGRVEAELEIMEDLGERVRKLREKREALRTVGKMEGDAGEIRIGMPDEKSTDVVENDQENNEDDNDDDDDDIDDWYT